MAAEFRVFADCKCTLSESPMWHKAQQKLYWRGFHGEIYRKDYNDDPTDFECFQLNIGNIGSMAFTETDEILLFADEGKVWRWVPGQEPVLYRKLHSSLFNDCIVDPKGRVFCGVLAEHYFDLPNRGDHGWLYRLDPDGNFTLLDTVADTPNGIRFSNDYTKLYFAVTDSDAIFEYDLDLENGTVCNRRVFADHCYPDGITVDAAGNVWNTYCVHGKPLQVFSPEGNLIREYTLPVHRVISVAFGGPDNKSVFVTTAKENDPVGEHDGGVFVMENDVAGCEEFLYTI